MSETSDIADVLEKRPPSNWILQHPTYQLMKNLEVGDSEQEHAAFLVYMDLSEVRQWKEVSCVKCPELQVVLLEGKEKEGAPVQTILPLPVHRSLSHKRTLPGCGTPAASEETAAALSSWSEKTP
uniref:tRNA-splicing endonuclease subunit Sen15 isoform X2 n=1 Tax=Scatophagus argus TaxID=75038 RepID=UPI001ED7E0B4|nr:tRNA-splicing endonuclease subunit Sen15 isoform X2 [Scatophagus argus]